MIRKLVIENFKKITFLSLENNDDDLVEIQGKNAQGKTSVLEAIECTLLGDRKLPDNPIQNGKDIGQVIIETDEFKVQKRLMKNKHGVTTTSLIVWDKEGNQINSPQTFLNKVLGTSSINPMEFVFKKPLERVEILRKALAIDFTEIDKERGRLYQERLEVGRTLKLIEGQLIEYRDLTRVPGATRSSAEILKDIAVAERPFARERESKKLREKEDARIAEHDAQDLKLQDLIRVKQKRISELEHLIEKERAEGSKAVEQRKEVVAARQTLIDNQKEGYVVTQDQVEHKDKLMEELNASALHAKEVERFEQKGKLEQRYKETKEERDGITSAIEGIDEKKKQILRDTKFPIPGLAFGEEDVELDGITFANTSTAEKIRVSTAILMANNPSAKILRIEEGSLLDDRSKGELRKLCGQYGFQVFIETVKKDQNSNALMLEDGGVA